jgi:thiamine biosynthesis lipoprotein
MPPLQSSVSFPALGSVAFVAVTHPSQLAEARAAVEETVVEFDIACSRFREDSELSALNAAAGSEVRVSPLLMEAVRAALRAARLTEGDVDPTIGEALVALGYDRDFDAIDAEDASRPVSIASVPGWWTVHLDAERSTIRLPRGVRLDLGATAKALAADHAAIRAGVFAGCGVLVGLGGDFATSGPAPAGGGWRVRVTDDHRAGVEAPGQWISMTSGGLATSSTSVRRWRTAGVPGSGSASGSASGSSSGSASGSSSGSASGSSSGSASGSSSGAASGSSSGAASGPAFAHHLIDPATGASADSIWRTVSVCAASCLDANIASTAAIVRGARAVGWLASLGLPSRLVSVEGRVTHVAGWPQNGDDLPSAIDSGSPAAAVSSL